MPDKLDRHAHNCRNIDNKRNIDPNAYWFQERGGISVRFYGWLTVWIPIAELRRFIRLHDEDGGEGDG